MTALYRLGFIIDFLSKAILIGFMAGAAIIVSLQQLKSLLGITHFTKEMSIIPVMRSVFDHIDEVNNFSLASFFRKKFQEFVSRKNSKLFLFRIKLGTWVHFRP
jgi:MFS superfamily sulfate permease-like transporter